MVKLVQGAGVLLGVGVAADYYSRTGVDRDYNFSLITDDNGKLDVRKDNHSGKLYVLSEKHETRFNFTNRTMPRMFVDVRIFEPVRCTVVFTPPGKNCRSDDVRIGPGERATIRAHVKNWDGEKCKKGKECRFDIQVKSATTSDWKEVDPDLRIERDGKLPDWLCVLLAATSVAMIAAPIFQDYGPRRRRDPER